MNSDPASFRDRYQDVLRELVEAKTAGLETMPLAIQGHRSGGSLETQPRAGRRAAAEESAVGKPTRSKAVPDRGQRALLLPVSVAGRQTQLVA